MDKIVWVLLGLAFAIYLLVGPGFGLAAFGRLKSLQQQLAATLDALRRLDSEQIELRRQMGRLSGQPPTVAAPPPPQPSSAPVVPPTPWESAERGSRPPAVVPPAPPVAPVSGSASSKEPGLEERLASRWLVWLGAGTLALAAGFLVKYSIDQGLLSPVVRVLMGALFGLGLIAAGEWVRARPLGHAIASMQPNTVPPALIAAGLFALFASVFAAYELYALIGPLLAFALLGSVAAGAGVLAIWHGPFVALLGILGGYLTPFLVSTGQPSAWGLFPYLLAITAGALLVVRVIGAAWLAWAALAGAALWPLLWMATTWSPGDVLPLATYLLLVGLFLFLLRVPGTRSRPVTLSDGFGGLSPADRVALTAALAVASLLYALVRMDRYGPGGLVAAALLIACYLAFARRESAFDVLAPVSAGVALCLLATWHLPTLITRNAPMISIMGETQGTVPGPILPPELQVFAVVAAGLSALIAGGGFIALWGARRPGLFAWSSGFTPVLALAIGY